MERIIRILLFVIAAFFFSMAVSGVKPCFFWFYVIAGFVFIGLLIWVNEKT